MKNLSELNAKLYWRLIKVIYVILFLFILIGGIVAISEEQWQGKIDTNNTKVICYSPDDRQFLYPEKHKIFSLTEVGIGELESNYNLRINGFNYESFITNFPYQSLQVTIFCMNENGKNVDGYEKEDISKYNISGIDMFIWQKFYELRYGKNNIFSNKKFGDEVLQEETDNFNKQMQEYDDYINNSYSDYDRVSKLDFSIKMFDLKIKYIYSEFILYILGFIILVYISFEGIRRLFYYIVLGQFFPKKYE